MALYNIPQGLISTAQAELLGQGQRAAGATAIKDYASLANNQTLTLLENVAGVPTLVTFEMQKDGSFTPTGGSVVPLDLTDATDDATAWAAIVAFLNARPNAAYTFTASASGYTFQAKLAGDEWNVLAAGTAINTSGTNAITTWGGDAIATGALVDGANDEQYQAGLACRVCGIHPRKLVSRYTMFDFSSTPTGFTAQYVAYDARGATQTATPSIVGWAANNLRYFPGSTFGATKWALGAKILIGNDNTEAVLFLHASSQDAIGVNVSRTNGVQIRYASSLNPADPVAWAGANTVQVIPASALTGAGNHVMALYSRGDGTFVVMFDNVFYGSYTINQQSVWSVSGSALGHARDSGGASAASWGALWFMGDFRGWA